MKTLAVTESQMHDYEAYFGLDRDALVPYIASEYGYYLVVVDDETEVIYQ